MDVLPYFIICIVYSVYSDMFAMMAHNLSKMTRISDTHKIHQIDELFNALHFQNFRDWKWRFNYPTKFGTQPLYKQFVRHMSVPNLKPINAYYISFFKLQVDGGLFLLTCQPSLPSLWLSTGSVLHKPPDCYSWLLSPRQQITVNLIDEDAGRRALSDIVLRPLIPRGSNMPSWLDCSFICSPQ